MGSSTLISQEMYYLVWIKTARQCISLYVTVKAFQKCCTSNAMDGIDDMLWNSSEDGNIRSECKEDEETDCEDGDSDTIGKVDRF